VDATGKRTPFPRNQIPLSLYDPVALKLFSECAMSKRGGDRRLFCVTE
jgi:hypothetical protein